MSPGQGPHLLLCIECGTWHTMEITNACDIELENLVALFHDYWFFTILDPAVVSGVWILVNSVKQEKGEKGHRENAEKSYCEE